VRAREGNFDARGRRFAVVAGRFNQVVTEGLLEGALSAFRRHGVAGDDVEVAWVPGSFEIPVVARRFARSGEVEAVVCLGAVIRGETAHFDLVAGESARGIQQVAIDTGVPCWRPTASIKLSTAPGASTGTRDGTPRSPRSRWPA
jgi:6,7-dimethyl-8-ribityllumazine synthase